MDHIRYFQVQFIVFVVLSMFGKECRSYCEIDFHMESPALMLLQGQNSSVLCDATCFAGQGLVDLFWTDARNNRIGSIPNSVFAVRYNRGLMNRLIIIGASGSKSGPYVCSVMRNGAVLDQRAVNVLVLGDSENTETQRPADTGPRRGDMTPRRDLNYRPVRSVPQQPSYPLVGRLIFDLHKRDNDLQHEDSKDHQIWENIQHGNTDGVISYEPKSLTKQNPGSIIGSNLKQESIRNEDIQVVDKSIDAADKNKEITSQEKHKKISDISKPDIGKVDESLNSLSAIKGNKLTLSAIKGNNFTNPAIKGNKFTNPAIKGNKFTNRHKVNNELLQVRIKRENTKSTLQTPTKDAENTTQDSLTSGKIGIITKPTLYAEIYDDFNSSDTNDGESEISTSSLSNDITEEISAFTGSTDKDSNKDAQDGSGRSDEDEDAPDSGFFNVEKSTCADGQREESTFGKYGVLAFAVSLAVVLLLVYAVIMILCMPRMMAMRRGRLDVKGAAFKKEGPNDAETATLNVLDGVAVVEVDLNEVKSDAVNQEKSLTSDSNQLQEKESGSLESPVTVSSFLIGQEAQRKAEDETNKSTNENKEDSKSGENTDKSSSKPEAETTPNSVGQPGQSDAIKLENEKEDKRLESSELSCELLSSILPELTIPGSAEIKGQIEGNCQNHAVSDAAAVSTTDHGFEKDSNPDRQSLANLPPPPAAETEELNRVTLV